MYYEFCMNAGFVSGFYSGGKHIAANLRGGGESRIGKANFQGGGGKSTPWPPEINPVNVINTPHPP